MEYSESSIKKLQIEVKSLESQIDVLQARLNSEILATETDQKNQKTQVHQNKSFLRFLYELNFVHDLEDLFLLMRKEIKHKHHLGEPMFVFQRSGREDMVYFFQGQNLLIKKSDPLKSLPEMSSLSAPIKVQLANVIGRPLANTFCFSLSLKTYKQISSQTRLYFLVDSLEGDFSPEQVQWIEDHLRVLDFALDRKLLEERAHLLAQRWKKTFDDFKDPICIKNAKKEIIRANQSYFLCTQFENYTQRIHPLMDPLTGQTVGQIEFYIFEREFENIFKLEAQNEKMAALGKLAGNLAHELNNPLTGILAMAQLLLTEQSDRATSFAKDLVEVEKAARRCYKIISNLTRFSLKENAPKIQGERTRPDEGIQSVMVLLRSRLRAFHLETQLNCEGYWIHAPSQLFQQVIFNVLHNACQEMTEGDHLRISSTIRARDLSEVVSIEIEDSGPGISEQNRGQIFEPFFTTKRQGEGTGLGLYLSKSIVEKFGGRLYFRDRGSLRGTVFVIEFPVAGQYL